MTKAQLSCVLAVLMLAAGPARAQDDSDQGDLIAMGGDYTPETWPVERALQLPVLASGLWQVEASLATSVGAEPGRPVLLAPGVAYGLSEKFTLRAVHTSGLCLALGADGVCPVVYGGLRALTRLSVVQVAYKVHVALQGGLLLENVDPVTLGAEFGVVAKLMFGRVAVELEPRVEVALNQREVRTREVVVLPAELIIQAAPRLALVAQASLRGGVSNLDDSGRLGLAAGAWWTRGRRLDVGAMLAFDAVAGAGATADARSLLVMARQRW